MREEDLIPAFLDTLKELDFESVVRGICDDPDNKPVFDWLDDPENVECPEWIGDFLDMLFNRLNDYAPPYFYFGSHPGDGADYGFWLGDDFQQQFKDDGGLQVNDTGEVPADYSGEVLHVNDHGNCTLYTADNGKLTEVWSVV